MKPAAAAAAIALSVLAASCAGVSAEPVQQDVYAAGRDGYASYRIPAVAVSAKGTVLAFAEGRRDGGGDAGRIDTVLRRSFDAGETWQPMQVVWSDGANTCGNPAPVVDRDTGRIWLAGTWNLATDTEKEIMAGTSEKSRHVFISHSDDDGATWQGPREITADAKLDHWRWYATGPGHAIQLSTGRILIPANHSDHSTGLHPYRSHAIVSDDHGATWKLGGIAGERTNESTAVELEDGRVLLNMRSYHELGRRAVAFSADGGSTWGGTYLDPALVEPVCQASIFRYDREGATSAYLFANPASTQRERMTVRASTDSCATWNAGRVLHEGFSAYSDICALPRGTVGVLYERDADGARYGRITFARFPLAWVVEEKGVPDEPLPEDKGTLP